ncbi:MAG: c-type cytochrome [Gammaproteobacteria bacterium]
MRRPVDAGRYCGNRRIHTRAQTPSTNFRSINNAATAPPDIVQQGKALYHKYCVACHCKGVMSGGTLPDLRYTQMRDVWDQVVLEGLLTSRGMVSFDQVLRKEDARAIQSYVIARALLDKAYLEQVH